MSVTGKRKQLKQGIIKILTEWIVPGNINGIEEVTADIMALVPKPEKCVMYRITTVNGVEYFKCSKCDGVQFDTPHRFCPHCARRVIATEDMTLWL